MSGVTGHCLLRSHGFSCPPFLRQNPEGLILEISCGDIYRIGGYVSDGDLASILAKEAQQAFEYLDLLGVPFVREKMVGSISSSRRF